MRTEKRRHQVSCPGCGTNILLNRILSPSRLLECGQCGVILQIDSEQPAHLRFAVDAAEYESVEAGERLGSRHFGNGHSQVDGAT